MTTMKPSPNSLLEHALFSYVHTPYSSTHVCLYVLESSQSTVTSYLRETSLESFSLKLLERNQHSKGSYFSDLRVTLRRSSCPLKWLIKDRWRVRQTKVSYTEVGTPCFDNGRLFYSVFVQLFPSFVYHFNHVQQFTSIVNFSRKINDVWTDTTILWFYRPIR